MHRSIAKRCKPSSAAARQPKRSQNPPGELAPCEVRGAFFSKRAQYCYTRRASPHDFFLPRALCLVRELFLSAARHFVRRKQCPPKSCLSSTLKRKVALAFRGYRNQNAHNVECLCIGFIAHRRRGLALAGFRATLNCGCALTDDVVFGDRDHARTKTRMASFAVHPLVADEWRADRFRLWRLGRQPG